MAIICNGQIFLGKFGVKLKKSSFLHYFTLICIIFAVYFTEHWCSFFVKRVIDFREISSAVEHWLPKPRVVGSNPIFRSQFISVRNVAQLVAHYVRDVGVGRSSRLIPTKGDK